VRRHRELIAAVAVVTVTACSADTFTSGDAASDAATSSDAASDATTLDAAADGAPNVQPVTCGQTTCGIGEACCVYTSVTNDGGLAVSTSCATQCPAPSAGQQLAELGCTSTAECGSYVCCVHRSNNVDVSACAPTCLSSNNEVQLCDPQAADAGCPPSDPCSTNNIADWNLPTTFATCGGKSVP
jgi:hypothetical protein